MDLRVLAGDPADPLLGALGEGFVGAEDVNGFAAPFVRLAKGESAGSS